MEERRMVLQAADALKSDNLYDFICNHGHEMSKDELSNIIKELVYAVGKVCLLESDKQDIFNAAADELIDQYEEEKNNG